MKLNTHIKGGLIAKSDAAAISGYFKTQKDGVYTIEIKKHRKTRTNDQNRLLWDLYNQVSLQTGYESDELHSMCGQMFLLRVDERMKKEYVISTSKLNTKEMTDYINRIVRYFTAECGFVITMPEDRNER
jgi:hypothetical protein